MAEQHSIDEAIAHLGAALAQSIAEDDQIIMGHVRHAHTLLKPLHSAYGTGSTGTHDDLVAALRTISDMAGTVTTGTSWGNAILAARAALAKASAS